MSNPRKIHVGKSKVEQQAYKRMLKTQQSEDPTYDPFDTESTNTGLINDTGRSSITEHKLKPYHKPSSFPLSLRELIIGILLFGITTALFLFGMSLNRDIGVLMERTSNAEKDREKVSKKLDDTNDKLENLRIDIEVLKKSNSK